jgi:hypothetical protein
LNAQSINSFNRGAGGMAFIIHMSDWPFLLVQGDNRQKYKGKLVRFIAITDEDESKRLCTLIHAD